MTDYLVLARLFYCYRVIALSDTLFITHHSYPPIMNWSAVVYDTRHAPERATALGITPTCAGYNHSTAMRACKAQSAL